MLKKLFVFFFFSCFISFVNATPSDGISKFIDYLNQEKIHLIASNEQSLEIKMPVDQIELNQRKKENQVSRSLLDAKITNLETFLTSQRKEQQALADRLKQIHQLSLDNPNEAINQDKLSKVKDLDNLNNKSIELLNENLQYANRYKKTLIVQEQQLKNWQAGFDEERKLNELNQRIKILYQAKDALYQKNVEIQRDQQIDSGFTTKIHFEAKLLLNNQIISLIQLRISELSLQRQRIKADYQLLNSPDIKTLQNTTTIYKQSIEQLYSIEQSLRKMSDLLKNEEKIVSQANLKNRFIDVNKTVNARLDEVITEQKTLKNEIETKQHQFKLQLSVRQSLSEYYIDSWPIIFNQIAYIPSQLYNYLYALTLKIIDSFKWQGLWHATLFWTGLLLVLSLGVLVNRFLSKITNDKQRSRLSAHLFDGILILLYRNMPYLTLAGVLSFIFLLNDIPNIHYHLLANLFVVWLVFRNLIMIARLTLLESVSDVSGKDVRLYYRLKWILLAGGLSCGLSVFSNQFPFPSLLQDVFSRVFMLLLLVVSIVLWTSKDIIPYLLQPVLNSKKRYVNNIISLMSILLPLTLLTSAIIGFSGYINLAWTMNRYQFCVLLIITGYMLARGLVFDALELLSEWMIAKLKNGWLWREVILKPLDKICRAVLFLLSTVILLELFGFNSNSALFAKLINFGKHPLVQTSGINITLFSTVEFILLLFIFAWAAKWTREFCYRWLYRHAKDPGIRNSLSVFTQYAVILIGGFITFRVLGLDFSGMSMILGGLAVGMGFGLRDFASNVIGGLMLLIERPVREGDLITLGEHEGRVSHIGIRSMRVCSWDNTEILIPNAETFNKPFTNWTHQDDIIRTSIPIKVSRTDDPVMIQQLIIDVIATIPEILSTPNPEVFLSHIDDALISFELRYYISLASHSRFEVKSRILFAIHEQFKKSGIDAPIQPLRIELQDSGYAHYKKTIKERERTTPTIRED